MAAEGIGDALTTSVHTSLAAVRAPARSPAAAFAQIPSTLLLTLAESVGSRAMIDLQIATYCATPAALGALEAVLDVVVVVAGAVVLGAGVEVTTGVLVDPLVLELLLPHPVASAPQSNAATSSGDRLAIIGLPWV